MTCPCDVCGATRSTGESQVWIGYDTCTDCEALLAARLPDDEEVAA